MFASAAAVTAAWEGKVMTVTGLISADQMGITLPHEHLLIVHHGPDVDLTDEALATSELRWFSLAGGKTLVELTNFGIGRDPAAMKRIAEQTGVQVVMGCGYYKDTKQSDAVRAKSEETIAQEIVRDVVEGVDGVHAGVIGEIGVSRPITAFEERQLRATAKAQKATGAAVNLHFDIQTTPVEHHYALDILEQAGADLSRVVISHLPPRLEEVDRCVALAGRGCYVELDLFGMELFPDVVRQLKGTEDPVAATKSLIDRGCLEQLLISQDLCAQVCYKKNGGYGYDNLLKRIVPMFREAGITDEQIRTIMVENPKRVFPFKNYARQSAAAGEMNMFKGLDHLAIAVASTEEALKIWRDRFGFSVLFSEKVAGGATRLTHLDLGNTQLQLVEPLTPDHPLRAWLAQHGPGLHHFCFKIDDVAQAFVEFPIAGLPVAPTIHQGVQGKRALFLDKTMTQDVQVEVTGA